MVINNKYMLVRNHDGQLVKIEKNQYTSDKQYYIDLIKLKFPNEVTETSKNVMQDILYKITDGGT